MLNDCVSARWSPMYQYLALTSLRDSHRLPTRHIREPGNVRRLFFSLPYFVSVLPFPYFGFRTSAFSTCPACPNRVVLAKICLEVGLTAHFQSSRFIVAYRAHIYIFPEGKYAHCWACSYTDGQTGRTYTRESSKSQCV